MFRNIDAPVKVQQQAVRRGLLLVDGTVRPDDAADS